MPFVSVSLVNYFPPLINILVIIEPIEFPTTIVRNFVRFTIDGAKTRNGKLALDVTQMVSREGDLDFTKAITDLKMLDYAHQATLSNAGKMYSNTLLNYMR